MSEGASVAERNFQQRICSLSSKVFNCPFSRLCIRQQSPASCSWLFLLLRFRKQKPNFGGSRSEIQGRSMIRVHLQPSVKLLVRKLAFSEPITSLTHSHTYTRSAVGPPLLLRMTSRTRSRRDGHNATLPSPRQHSLVKVHLDLWPFLQPAPYYA